jgi:hypothetical protein
LKSKLVKCKSTGPLNEPEKLNSGGLTKHVPAQAKPVNCIVANPIKSRVGAFVFGITGPVPLKLTFIATLPMSAVPAIPA